MTIAIIRGLVLVTLGVAVAGHTLVQWARRRGGPADLVPPLAIGIGTVAVGLALDATGACATVVVVAALALIVVALLALVRRRAGPAL